MAADMTIGRLAAAAGVNVETVRYYQRRHLLEAPPRTAGAIARYPQDALTRLRFIKRAQSLGFSLADVRELLSLEDARACDTARGIGERKLAEVQQHIRRLRALEQALNRLVSRCATHRRTVSCPLLDALLRDEDLPDAAGVADGGASR